MGNSINLTFKKNKEEQELQQWIRKHTNFSCFIKDILIKEKTKEEIEKSKTKAISGFLTLNE